MFRDHACELIQDCTSPKNSQFLAIARIIRQIDADVILLNEFDYDHKEGAAQAFLKNYLPDLYPHHFSAPVNTGVPSGFDLNGDGDANDPEDSFGYGKHPGQYGMLLLSKSPILRQDVRTFQKFLWKDLPSHVMPAAHYPEAARDQIRLSSKSHWDVPIKHGARRSLSGSSARSNSLVFQKPLGCTDQAWRCGDSFSLLASYATVVR
jgi:hypothetical protein